MTVEPYTVGANEPILITGATGFIGSRVVAELVARGFCNLRCFARPTSNTTALRQLMASYGPNVHIEIVDGNLLSRQSCATATRDVSLILHLAAARGEKSIP